jgi:hypothetical protein
MIAMKVKCIVYGLMIFSLTGIFLPYSSTISYGQQQTPVFKNILFSPFAYLQYGPAPTDAIPMLFRSANFLNSQNNQTLTFYSPSTIMSNYTQALPLYYNDTFQPTFDSYFIFNRLSTQFLPNVTNASVTIARILNPDAQYIIQTKYSNPTSLGSPNKAHVTNSFSIPSLKSGFYLAKLSVYFPEYKIHAIYSNSVHIFNVTRPSLVSSLANNRSSSSFNSSSLLKY